VSSLVTVSERRVDMFIQEKTISKPTDQTTNPPKTTDTHPSVSGGHPAGSNAASQKRRMPGFLRKALALIFSPRGIRAVLISYAVMIALTVCATAAAVIVGVVAADYDASAKLNHTDYSSYNRVFLGFEPTVNVTIDLGDGRVITSNMPQLTVGEFIDSLDIELDSGDVLSHPEDSVLTNDMEISLTRTEYKDVTIKDNIPYSTEYIESQTVPRGTQKVVTAGQYGVSTRVLRQKYVNGKLESETVISESVTKKPVNKVVATGIGGTFVGGDGKTYSYSYYIDVSATAYTGGGLTYSGKPTGPGIIAVDKKVIALGSKVYVTGNYGDYGICSAEDIGGGIKNNKIDIWLPTEEECKAFGIRKMRAYILD